MATTNQYFIYDDSNPPNIILNADHMEAYIPDELFREDRETASTIAIVYGDAVRAVGLFMVRFYSDDDNIEEIRHTLPLYIFNYPNMITTYPSSIKTTTLAIEKGKEAEPCRILTYDRGDIIMMGQTPKSSDNCEKFTGALFKGKIPSSIPYMNVLDSWESNFDINGVSPGVPSIALQIVLGQLYRDQNNPYNPYRKIVGKDMNDQTSYMNAGMKTATALTSVFGGLTYEDMGFMLTSGITMSMENIPQVQSPLEDVLSM